MPVDPLKLDNPVNPAAMPKHKFPIQFIAQTQFNAIELARPTLVLAAVLMIASCFAFVVVLTIPQSAALVGWCSRPWMLIFSIVVMIRWDLKSESLFCLTIATAILGLILTVASIPLGLKDQTLRSTCVFATIALMWNAVEIGIHFRSLDVELMRRDPTSAQITRERDVNALQLVAVGFVVLICFALWANSRLIALPIVSTFGLLIAYARAVKIAKYPLVFLQSTIVNYFRYPDTSLLAPGLIASAAAAPIFRPVPVLIVAMCMPLLSAGETTFEAVVTAAAWLLFIGFYSTLSLLLVGASFTARPIHFDSFNTPFDVIVARLRDQEHSNG